MSGFFSGTNQIDFPAFSLPGPLRCLLLGIRGAGMSALAQILEDLGHTVIGADRSCTATDIATATAEFPGRRTVPWAPNSLPTESTDICVVTPALAENCPLLNKVVADGIPTMTLHECLAEVFQAKKQLCIAGTHGKTTTSAMVAWILRHAGQNPSYFVGGELVDIQTSGAFEHGDWAVIESCEFSSSFQCLRPQTILLTGIERDHFDRFPSEQEEDSAFGDFVSQLPHDGSLIINADCPRSVQLIEARGCRPVTVGQHRQTADWVATDVQISESETSFLCGFHGQQMRVQLRVPGRHNVRNAIAAIAAAAQIGISAEVSIAALHTFSGVRRRFELRGRPNGVYLVDDYAHHPTAIQETLATARSVFPGRRLIVIFEPHQIRRTQELFADFVNSLAFADETLLLPVFPARENVTHPECCRISGQLVKALNRQECKAFLFANLDQIVSRIDHSGRPSDVFIAMGAGNTHLIYDQLTRRLQRHSVA